MINHEIKITDLTFHYSRRQQLFNRLNINLFPGHLYGLLGKNGEGKSTLLRLIGGLLYPKAGSVVVAGHHPRRRQPAFLQEIFFLPEEIYLPSVRIKRFMESRSVFYPNFSKDQFFQGLQRFEIEAKENLNNLSFGQKKKVLIAFALAANTPVVVMDEPTNGLDIPSKKQFRQLIAAHFTEEHLFLISTHQVKDLENLIDQVLIMHQHQILINEKLDVLGEKLSFSKLSNTENNQQLLYAEPSLHGYDAVLENINQSDNKVELEPLFNAAVSQPERLARLLQTAPKSKEL